MSDSNTPRLGLPYLAAGQAQKHVTLNGALATLDGLVQTAVESRTLLTPPTSPMDGQIGLVPPSPTSADWMGLTDKLARYEGGNWSTLPVVEGHLIYVKDDREVFESVESGRVQVGFVVKPTTVEQVLAVSETGEVMPQKSTFFYPKIMTGLLFNPLE